MTYTDMTRTDMTRTDVSGPDMTGPEMTGPDATGQDSTGYAPAAPDSALFFGAVLKTIASTRNHATDQQAYADGVLEPAGRIRAAEQEAAGRPLTAHETGEVLGLLETTFRTKRTPDEERAYYLQYIERVSGVSLASLGVSAP
ncbi:hypothetical protein OG897_29750 [Streptomyces sp. NBC_00237]|uniref:hypothetical protein n=1 Tax=Streptomyces sp. NBC_00237 TaxID=2975687 RepID=UPI0022534DB8|nr:hypothetical protein [Streptomyces sp. NBC_00237]MCX5205629.1 hypothetical protein [Streptomyces sp. NBC_00237]